MPNQIPSVAYFCPLGMILNQQDYTNHGIANDFVTAGIPTSQLVLAYKPLSLRNQTEFAAA
jgi:XisI protein